MESSILNVTLSLRITLLTTLNPCHPQHVKVPKACVKSFENKYGIVLCIGSHGCDANLSNVQARRLCSWNIHRHPDSWSLSATFKSKCENEQSQHQHTHTPNSVCKNNKMLNEEWSFDFCYNTKRINFFSLAWHTYPGSKPILEDGDSIGTRASGTPRIGTTRRMVTSFPACNLHSNYVIMFIATNKVQCLTSLNRHNPLELNFHAFSLFFNLMVSCFRLPLFWIISLKLNTLPDHPMTVNQTPWYMSFRRV